MDPNPKSSDQNSMTHPHPTAILRRKIPLRRRKLQTVRLGGKKPRRGFFLARLLRRGRGRVRWLRLKYSCMLKSLRRCYRSLARDIMESSAAMESIQQRILMETSFAIPVMGISLNGFSNVYGIDHRT